MKKYFFHKNFINIFTKFYRLNNEILGALLRKATYSKDYDYVIDILEYAMSENLKPSYRFAEALGIFKNTRYYALQKQDSEEELIKYKAFYKVYKEWKSQMELTGLSADDVKKLLHVHPWKQLKEGEGEGIEDIKNIKTRRLWKRQMVLKKLTPISVDKIHSQNKTNPEEKNEAENSKEKSEAENPEQIDSK